MASKILERSGRSVVEYCNLIGWKPSHVCIVGVGPQHGEILPMQAAWPDTTYTGFEPHPDVCAQASKDFPGDLYAYAVSDHSGKSTLYVPRNWKNGCSLFELDPKIQCKTVEVDLVRLDDIFPFIPGKSMVYSRDRDTLLWLDCEGSELNALVGGEHFIDERVMMVNIEITGIPRGKDWCKPIQVHRRLMKSGFLQTWSHTHRTAIGQWDGIYVRPNIFKPQFCNSLDSVERYEELLKDDNK